MGHGDLLCTPWPPLPARTHTPHTSTATRAEETHGRVLGGDPAVFMGISRAPDLVTLTVLLADFRGPCTNSQGLGEGSDPSPEQRTAVCKGPQAEPSQTNRDQEGKETMGQAPPTGTTSWDRPRPQAQPPGTGPAHRHNLVTASGAPPLRSPLGLYFHCLAQTSL